MKGLVVLGVQWGDEGKGKIIDALSHSARAVVRFHGGHNAGHTLIVDGETFKLQLLPCGILHQDAKCFISAGMVLELSLINQEIAKVRQLGLRVDASRLGIDLRAHVVLPWHVQLDTLRDAKSGIGTTKRGIGPCYEDKVSRLGVRVEDFFDRDRLLERLEKIYYEKEALISLYSGGKEKLPGAEAVADSLLKDFETLKPFVTDASSEVQEFLAGGSPVLFEGAQAASLDCTFGTYPFVTSSNTIAGSVCTGVGLSPKSVGYVLGVAKSYATRVGSGPFPTELDNEIGEKIRANGREFGTVTGRPRRCGWFDAIEVKRMALINGCDSIAITKLDVLTGFSTVEIRTGEGQIEKLPGWNEDITSCRSYGELPANAKAVLDLIEKSIKTPISLVSVGAGREQMIARKIDGLLAEFVGE